MELTNCPFCGGNKAVYEMEQHRNKVERERDEARAMLAELCRAQIANIGTKNQFLSFGGLSWPDRTMASERWALWERARVLAGIGPTTFLEPDAKPDNASQPKSAAKG